MTAPSTLLLRERTKRERCGVLGFNNQHNHPWPFIRPFAQAHAGPKTNLGKPQSQLGFLPVSIIISE